MFDYIIFASYGNDSIALIQWAHEKGLKNVCCLFSDTGWAKPEWMERVSKGEDLARSYGFSTDRTESEGMLALIKRKSGWPQGGGAATFCTGELKIKPSLEWMDANDFEHDAICLTGVRRSESRHRASAPEFIEESKRHGDRQLWQPLVRHTNDMRNKLVQAAGFEVLPHRSQECFPCINANIDDLRLLDESRIQVIEIAENNLGFTKKGHPRVMFRPKRHKGQTGIRAVVAWASVLRNRDQTDMFDLGNGAGCDSGYCGG